MTEEVRRCWDFTDHREQSAAGVVAVYVNGFKLRLTSTYVDRRLINFYSSTLWGRLPDDSIRDCNELFVLDEEG